MIFNIIIKIFHKFVIAIIIKKHTILFFISIIICNLYDLIKCLKHYLYQNIFPNNINNMKI